MHHEKQEVHPSLLRMSSVSPQPQPVTEARDQSLLAFILSERWNDLSTNATYYKQSLTKKVTN